MPDTQINPTAAALLGMRHEGPMTGGQLMAAADLLVLPSYDEGLPLVILEAMANGVAVVCTPVGEIPSVFTDGREVKFVTAGDAQSIAAGLKDVLDNQGLRETLEANGRARYQQQFSLRSFFASVAAVHKKYFGSSGQLGSASADNARAQQ